MGEVARQAPGAALSSFPAGLMRQGVKKHHGKDLQSSHPGGRYGQVGQAMMKASLPREVLPVVLGERYLASIWCGHLAVGACRVE